MDDLELSKLCDQVKRSTQMKGVIDLCLEVEKRLAEKTLPEPKKYNRKEQMAKYMREVYRPRVKAKSIPVSPRQARMAAAVDKAVAAARRPNHPDKQAKLESLHKMLGSNLVDPRKIAPEEDDIDFG